MPEFYAIVRGTWTKQYDFNADNYEEGVKKAVELGKKDAPDNAEIDVMEIYRRKLPLFKKNKKVM